MNGLVVGVGLDVIWNKWCLSGKHIFLVNKNVFS